MARRASFARLAHGLAGLALLACFAVQASAQSVPPAQSAAASNKTIATALKAAGLTDCLRLLQVADPTRRAEDPRTQATVICPTNAALRAFAARMGLKGGVDELAARTDLVDKLAAYHVAPRVRASASALKPGTFAVSGDPHYLLRFEAAANASGGTVAVRDAQGQAAKVVSGDIDAGRSVVHAVDRVLGSGEYFPSMREFAAFYAANFSGVATTLDALGIGSDGAWTGTLFAPLDAAVAAEPLAVARGSGGSTKAGQLKLLREVATYSQLPSEHVYPGGFARGGPASMATRLTGHNVTVEVSLRNVTRGGKVVTVLEGRVTPERGSPRPGAAVIGLPNVYVARGIVHGIAGVLVPAGIQDSAKAKAAGGRRHLLRGGFGGGFRGAGDFHAGAVGGWGAGAGGRAFDAAPRVDAAHIDTARVGYDGRGWGGYGVRPYGCCWGAGYTAAALGGAAIGAGVNAAVNAAVPPVVYSTAAPVSYDYEEPVYVPTPAPPPQVIYVPTPVPAPAPAAPPPPPPGVLAPPPGCINC